jgi:predicted metalloprotease
MGAPGTALNSASATTPPNRETAKVLDRAVFFIKNFIKNSLIQKISGRSIINHMANWGNISSRGNVEDRRGLGSTARFGGMGLVGIGMLFLINYLAGGSVTDVLPQIEQQMLVAKQQNVDPKDFEGNDQYEVFTATVLGSVNSMWEDVFAKSDSEYVAPKLVLFRGATDSACGGAWSEAGPHYCPTDQTIYLDETFFQELEDRFGAKGGDVAQAYVIAHEVGHHVQNELGLLDTDDTNRASVKTELQADCFAGLWAYSIKDRGVFLPGEIGEALDAAAAVGDDWIQKNTTGRVNPETWTHGSSAERVNAFNAGYEKGTVEACSDL